MVIFEGKSSLAGVGAIGKYAVKKQVSLPPIDSNPTSRSWNDIEGRECLYFSFTLVVFP